MSQFVEQLESRELFSTSYPAAGTYTGVAVPHGGPAIAAIVAATGTKKGGGTLDASLLLNIANNSILTGTLTLTTMAKASFATYVISGNVIGSYVSVSMESGGQVVGTFAGGLKQLNKRLIGPFTDTIHGASITGQMTLKNNAAIKTKTGGGKNKSNVLTNNPTETAPPITSGNTNSGNTIGDQTGISSGDNSGTGTISDGGSLLG